MIPTGIIGGVAAFALTALSVPVVIRLSARWGLFDAAGPLKIHARATSRLGGVAVVGSIVVGSIVAAQFLADPHAALRVTPLFAAIGILFGVGLADDLRGLSPFLRLTAQVVASSVIWLAGWHFPILSSHALSFITTVFFLLALTNAMNFFDGSDGLAAGVALIVATLFASLPGLGLTPTGKILAWSIAGASAAFLCSNFPPAKLFLGDTGSTVLGFSLAFLGLDPPSWPAPIPARFVLLLFAAALPIFDLVFAVIRRIRAGQSIFLGDRSHMCDLLLSRGWSPRRVAIACYVVTVSSAMAGWLSLRTERVGFVVVSVLILGALAWAGSWLGALGVRIGCYGLHRGNSS